MAMMKSVTNTLSDLDLAAPPWVATLDDQLLAEAVTLALFERFCAVRTGARRATLLTADFAIQSIASGQITGSVARRKAVAAWRMYVRASLADRNVTRVSVHWCPAYQTPTSQTVAAPRRPTRGAPTG